jgi:hypothetical protein
MFWRGTSWSSRIFWKVGRVIVDPSLDLPSPYEVIPLVLILVTALGAEPP